MERKEGITVELLFFNDLKNLERGVPTYIDYVDKVIAIDGRHRTNIFHNELSNDGSVEYLKSFNKVSLLQFPNEFEVVKRMAAKYLCDNNDLIIIDSDEYIIGDWDKFFKNFNKIKSIDFHRKNLYKVRIQRIDSSELFTYHPLLFHKPIEFTYYNGQHNIPIKKVDAFKSGIYAPESFNYPVEGITVMHDHKLRTPQHNKVREEHLKFLANTSH